MGAGQGLKRLGHPTLGWLLRRQWHGPRKMGRDAAVGPPLRHSLMHPRGCGGSQGSRKHVPNPDSTGGLWAPLQVLLRSEEQKRVECINDFILSLQFNSLQMNGITSYYESD